MRLLAFALGVLELSVSEAAWRGAAVVHASGRRAPVLVCCDDVESLRRQLREANQLAADSANAEARLRNMVSSANTNAERANEARETAEERAADLKLELDALRQLWSDESAALADELEQAKAEIARAEGGESATRSEQIEGETERELAEANSQLNALRVDLMRVQALAEDAHSELEALRELTRQEDVAKQATIDELTERVRVAELAVAAANPDDGERERQLEEQIVQLLGALQSAEAAAAELMIVRPKIAELEARLASHPPSSTSSMVDAP